jgi:folate-binding protein YgfZ
MNLFTALLVSGADARTFLQGQVTADLDALTAHNALLACANSPQGRVQAIFTLIERPEGIALLVLPEMADSLIARLRKYILRAKVQIEPLNVPVFGLSAAQLGLLGDSAPVGGMSGREHRLLGDRSVIRWSMHDDRFVLLGALAAEFQSRPDWLLAEIRAGFPHVMPPIHEAFVAQMLNLDVLNGINFEKGCYTGQEIIARMHFRGAVKRRMARFAFDGEPPASGARLMSDQAHAGDVVFAAPTASGCEFLAVINLAQADSVIHLEDRPSATVQRLPLPYPVNGLGS